MRVTVERIDLVDGDEFEVNHRNRCRRVRAIRRVEAHLEAHPELVGKGDAMTILG